MISTLQEIYCSMPRSKAWHWDLSRNQIATAYLNYPCIAIYDKKLNLVGKYDIGKRISTETSSGSDNSPELTNIKYHGGK